MPYQIENYKYIIIFLISIIPFLSLSIKGTSGRLLLYLYMCFSLGGTAQLVFTIINNFHATLISITTITCVFIIIKKVKKYTISYKKLYFEIKIIHNNKKYKIIGFCDTGNFLSYNNIPIVFIDSKFNIGIPVRMIFINTVNIKKKILIYKVDKFEIKINNKFINKDVFIAYSRIPLGAMFGVKLLGG